MIDPTEGVGLHRPTPPAEVGIDITQEFPTPWSREVVQAADVVVAMGCGDDPPIQGGVEPTLERCTRPTFIATDH